MTDYADLVKRLREPWGGKHLPHSEPDWVSSLVADAIAAIETLVCERDAARAERDELTERLQAVGLSAEAAEAEVVKLKAALMGLLDEPKNITKADLEFFEYCRVTTKAVLAARAALGGQPRTAQPGTR